MQELKNHFNMHDMENGLMQTNKHTSILCTSSQGLSLFYVDSLGGRGVKKMPILLNKISTKGGRGGQKSPKSCLRRIRTAPNTMGSHKTICQYFFNYIFCINCFYLHHKVLSTIVLSKTFKWYMYWCPQMFNGKIQIT